MNWLKQILLGVALAFVWAGLSANASLAAGSFPYSSERLTAYLITSEDGVTPSAETLSGGLQIELAPGWKTYWKSPGEVGFPPEILWEGSQNIAGIELLYPTPTRFRAFDIENYGYEKAVTFPLRITLENPGQAAEIVAKVTVLICEQICVPETFDLALSIPAGMGVDAQAAEQIAKAAASLPGSGAEIGLQVRGVYLDRAAAQMTVLAQSDTPLGGIEIFPDLGLEAAFGAPDVTLSEGGRAARITLEALSLPNELPDLSLVLATAQGSAEFQPALELAPAPKEQSSGAILWILVLALLGGLILNVMPCVLPVLSIKLTSALKARDQSQARIRAGFLMSALGVMAFMLALAAILVAVRMAGGQVGWGIQFQSPIFLAVMAVLVTLFAANMFGLFEINLPQSWTTSMDSAGRGAGLAGDFATGALAAVLATPCSAPFLGTAVTFALAGSGIETLVIFTALGLGLALPYLIIAARPALIQALPKPGRWMEVVKWVMGALLVLTALWLLSVLWGVAGARVAGIVALLLIAACVFIGLRGRINLMKPAAIAAVLGAVLVPAFLTQPPQAALARDSAWGAFDEARITDLVASGQVVFVDVTADWCLTCKTNKALVLDRSPVIDALERDGVTLMRADWTRPDETILSYLQAHDRFGIPFNIVYGPGAPDGIALSEILTRDAVINALSEAGG
jgi:suppressor for copper-sensitivity B